MRSTAGVTGFIVVASAITIGCAGGSHPPQDEARANYPNENYSTPADWQAVAQKYYAPAEGDYFEDMDAMGTADVIGAQKLKLAPEEIKGRNAWVLWAGGNQAFWDWLARHSYGSVDFLKLIDSQDRGRRFARTGLITEPGMRPPTEEETQQALGIRYDRPIKDDPDQKKIHVEYRKTESSGVSRTSPEYHIYGYPTGVVGLRLFKNPEFTPEAEARWKKAHEQDSERYYKDISYASRPDTIRPFRVGMSCGFCHIAPHPLKPPANPEFPEWENLSNNIGNQYLRFRATFGNTLKPNSYLYHILDAQLPGSLDTSLIPSDNLNNPNTINSFYGLRGRLERADNNSKETISGDTLTYLNKYVRENNMDFATPHPVPRVLLDGADSVGISLALSRVYLNIGTYHQQWIRLHNPLLGFRKQESFKLNVIAENSLYWHATLIRVAPLAAFFKVSTDPMRLKDAPLTPEQRAKHLKGTGVPWYTEAKKEEPKKDAPMPKTNDYSSGRMVFAKGCIACHSSIQPGDLPDLEILLNPEGKQNPGDPPNMLPGLGPVPADWAKKTDAEKKAFVAPRQGLRLRMEDLTSLTRGDGKLPPAYAQWAQAAVNHREFWEHTAKDGDKTVVVHNYMSTDVRIPVTLTHTNSQRAMGTNAVHGHMWEDFASQTYKELDSVGRISYHDPLSGAQKSFQAPSGGPGYYRVPTLISVWATAPFFHNNALGMFNNNPSVQGRLDSFDDSIRRLLWPERRMKPTAQHVWNVGEEPKLADKAATEQLDNDQGWVWRTQVDSWLTIEGSQIPTLLAGMTGWSDFMVRLVPWLPSLLFVILGSLLLTSGWLIDGRQALERLIPWLEWILAPFRWILAVGAFALAGLTAYFLWSKFGRLIEFLSVGLDSSIPWLDLQVASIPIFFLGVGALFFVSRLQIMSVRKRTMHWIGALCLIWAVILALGFGRFLSGRAGDVKIGPLPAGVPVNAIANLNPEAPDDQGKMARKALLKWVVDYNRADANNKPGRKEFEERVAPAFMNASKCPDLVTDRGHDYEFIRQLTDQEKEDLIALIKTF